MTSTLTCQQCATTFARETRKGPPSRYCSLDCRLSARGRGPISTHNANGYSHGCRCEVCSAAMRERMRGFFQKAGGNPHRKVAPKVACEGGCGKLIRGGKCRDCSYVPLTPVQIRRRRAVAKIARAAQGTKGKSRWVQGWCGDCGDWFTRRSNGRDAPFCSNKCRQRVARGNRRALEAGCKITPGRRYLVHDRDGWTCKLCGFPVNEQAVVPAVDAPVIDHIVSLARGGDHAPHNWQTAHFICNSYKRDLDMADVA